MRKALLLVVALFTMTLSYEVSAQQRVITGKVISEEDGLGLPGATVLIKGTTVGSTTDLDGNYSISVPAGSNVLIFSFVGLEPSEESIGNRSIINVTLAIDASQLSEVVVTAIGIEREKKALGYGVTNVGSEQLENRPEQDVARVLQGKVPGVNITSTNGMSGSGTNMVIRGYSSATGSNQPLFVVDGVPFNTSTNSTNDFNRGGATTSSRFLDIDPNNIESMSVLKGLSATVLYGDQGRNCVILITTKSGASKRKSAEVTINQSVFSNTAADVGTEESVRHGGGELGTKPKPKPRRATTPKTEDGFPHNRRVCSVGAARRNHGCWVHRVPTRAVRCPGVARRRRVRVRSRIRVRVRFRKRKRGTRGRRQTATRL
jgi:TonB-dependent SusC/RagA subfamily outer membrane receptor